MSSSTWRTRPGSPHSRLRQRSGGWVATKRQAASQAWPPAPRSALPSTAKCSCGRAGRACQTEHAAHGIAACGGKQAGCRHPTRRVRADTAWQAGMGGGVQTTLCPALPSPQPPRPHQVGRVLEQQHARLHRRPRQPQPADGLKPRPAGDGVLRQSSRKAPPSWGRLALHPGCRTGAAGTAAHTQREGCAAPCPRMARLRHGSAGQVCWLCMRLAGLTACTPSAPPGGARGSGCSICAPLRPRLTSQRQAREGLHARQRLQQRCTVARSVRNSHPQLLQARERRQACRQAGSAIERQASQGGQRGQAGHAVL